MELEVIGRMGFDAYFLIVWDFVKYAKDNGIAVGPGRGSAAGSIVSYALDITEVDPLKYGLLFERFLNPERVSMPDIDIDFSVKGRARVMRYVENKYGARVGGPDRDLRQDAAAQRHPRRGARARQGLRGRRPAGQAHPRAGHGPLAQPREVPGRRARAQEGLRHRGRGARGHRHRPRARGHRAQRRRARRRGGDRRPAAHRHRAAPADGGPRRRVRGRRARLQGHHAVLDGADRGARACSRWTSSACATWTSSRTA